jgi:ribosomal protein S18 acetylase RimI-like enzyme
MSRVLALRPLRLEDLNFADSLRSLAGWNQTHVDWKRMLALAPEGCFLAEWHGEAAGTATTTTYGPDLAWIGMVLVHPKFRRRGIGRALMEHCLDYLEGRRVRCCKLDATPLGRSVYAGLGFQDEWTLRRWEGPPLPSPPTSPPAAIRSWREFDAAVVEPVDAAAFGVSRRALLEALSEHSLGRMVIESEGGQVCGFGLLRQGSLADYLGPVTAVSSEGASPLLEQLLASAPGEKVIWDIPDQNAPAVAWASSHGFTPARTLIRMFRGENRAPGNPRRQFAIAGPEVG